VLPAGTVGRRQFRLQLLQTQAIVAVDHYAG
jgi:hypothetical protein